MYVCENKQGAATELRSCLKVKEPSWLPVPNKSYGFCGRRATLKKMRELRSGVEIEMAVLGSPSLISLTASVGLEQH